MLIGVIIVSAAVGRIFLAPYLEPSRLISWMREWGGSVAAIPLFLFGFGVATSLFSPAVVMMITAGVTWGFWPGWLWVWLAANLWSHVHFATGRWLAGEPVRLWLAKRDAQWLTRELDQGGVLTTIMVRQLPIPFPLVNVAAGASPMAWNKWAVGNAIGLLPNCLIYTQLASALADGASDARSTALGRVVLGGVAVISLSLVSRWLQKRFSVSAPVSAPPSKRAG